MISHFAEARSLDDFAFEFGVFDGFHEVAGHIYLAFVYEATYFLNKLLLPDSFLVNEGFFASFSNSTKPCFVLLFTPTYGNQMTLPFNDCTFKEYGLYFVLILGLVQFLKFLKARPIKKRHVASS